MQQEELGKLKEISNELIGNRTRDRPACSIVPQPTTLPRTPFYGNSPSNSGVMSVMRNTCFHLLTL
jgi:hypothetical protein